LIEKQLTVGIYERTYHPIYLYTIALLAIKNNCKVIIFSNESNCRDLLYLLDKSKHKYIELVKKNEDESEYSFLSRISKSYFRDIEALFINSIQGGIKEHQLPFLLIKLPKQVILSIHNPVQWQEIENIFPIKILLEFCIKTLILKRINHIIVVAAKIKEALKERVFFKNQKVHYIPFALPINTDLNKKNEDDGYLQLIFPGQFNASRRNFNLLLEILACLPDLDKKINIIFLGSISDDSEVYTKLKRFENDNVKITLPSTSFRSQKDYEKIIRNGHIIVGCISVEFYNKFKETGIIYDAIRYGLPLIINEGIIIPEGIKNSTLFYNDGEQFNEILAHLYSDLDNYHLKAQINSKKFSSEKYIENFNAILTS